MGGALMDEDAFAVEARVEATHWWFRGRRQLVGGVVRDLGLDPQARILDVGTGAGTNLRMLRELGFDAVVGIEPSPGAVDHCRVKGLTGLHRGDIRTLPFRDESFDLVLATDVLEHVLEDDVAATELFRVLRPGGVAVITVPTFMALWGRADEVGHHVRRYRLPELAGAVRGAGFDLLRLHHFNYLLFVPIGLARWVFRRFGFGPGNENDVGPSAVNRLLNRVFDLDVRSAGAVRPPFGVSALAVARRPAKPAISPPTWLPDMLAAPGGGRLSGWESGRPVLEDGSRIPVTATGILCFAEGSLREESAAQREHYDRVAGQYAENLDYPHTRIYQSYLDDQILEALPEGNLGTVAELCAGRGEAFDLLADRVERGLAVDISRSMLEQGVGRRPAEEVALVEADATEVPVLSGTCDHVLILGGVHHVPDRVALLREAARLLKPGGTVVFREPVDDFLPWRLLRSVIYRLSPALDASTEAPIRRHETERHLDAAGLELVHWETRGFVGFCLLMNSDVLVVNRLLRFLPGIATVTRTWVCIDEWCLRRRLLRGRGLQAVGVAVRHGDGLPSGDR